MARMEHSPDVQLAKNDAQEYQEYDASKNKERRFTEQGRKIYKDLMNKEQIFTEQGTILTEQRTKRELYVAR